MKRGTTMAQAGKAPAGGMVSAVNGQWYNGGEFTPDHGKFCGKGKHRVSLARFAEVAACVQAAGKVLSYREESQEFVVKYPTGNVMMRARGLDTIARCFRSA
jgi:hypothetical protein